MVASVQFVAGENTGKKGKGYPSVHYQVNRLPGRKESEELTSHLATSGWSGPGREDKGLCWFAWQHGSREPGTLYILLMATPPLDHFLAGWAAI